MIPIFRAKKINADEHVEGFYEGWNDKHFIVTTPTEYFKIDISTLAISFDNGKSFIKTSDLEVKTCFTYDLVYICEKNRQHREKQMGTGKIYTIITDKGV